MRGPDSYVFRTIVRFSFFVINALAVYLLLRGHNLPGGGFVGGLATAISLVLLSLALGLEEMHRVVRIDPVRVAVAGLILAVLTGAAPLLFDGAFLEHFSGHFTLPLLGSVHVGTPLLFDVGVYLVVVGVTTKLVFVLAKSTQGLRALVQEEEARYSSPREAPVEEQPVDEFVLEPEAREKIDAN
jgi:multicomponent Na+:H+ antiporter subunit B